MQNNGDHDDESKTSLTIESQDASTIRPAIRPMRRHVPNDDMMGSLVRHRRRVSPIILIQQMILIFIANTNIIILLGCILAAW